MLEQSDKKQLVNIIQIICLFFYIFAFVDYLFYNHFERGQINEIVYKGLWNLHERKTLWMITLSSPFLIIFLSVLDYNKPVENKKDYLINGLPFLFLELFVVLYYQKNEPLPYYNMIVYPLIHLIVTYFAYQFGKSFRMEIKSVTQDLWEEISLGKESEKSIDFEITTEKGVKKILRITSLAQGLIVVGGAGSGKSASWFEPIIYKTISKGFAGFIYDFKGKESPLARAAIETLNANKENIIKNGFKVPTVHVVNFTQPRKSTGWYNVLDPKYMTNSIQVASFAESFYKSLDKEAIKKTDFWAKNGILYTSKCAWFLVKNHPEYATIPHLITLMIQKISDVVKLLATDPEISATINSIRTAMENDAQSQLSGIEASAAIPFAGLFNKEQFWPLTPHHDIPSMPEINLQLNDKNDPTILCIANDESAKEAIGPLISCTASAIVQILNALPEPEDGEPVPYYKTLFMIDELPTLFIKDLHFVPATMRSKLVMCILGVQGISQIVLEYGKDIANVIVDNMGNQAYGMTNRGQEAEDIAKITGHYDRVKINTSYSDSGISMSESTQREQKLQGTDIASQQVGHFMVKVANGNPAYHFLQMADGRIHKLLKVDEKEIKPIKDNYIPIETKDKTLLNNVTNQILQQNFEKIQNDIKDLLESVQEAPTVD